jgi:tetratricopeptide (TPR) repeat protein
MINRLTASLREAPTTLPALAAVTLFVVWSFSQAGYPITHWAPGGLILLVLLGIALGVVDLRLATVPWAVKIALGCLMAYTVLSYLSILWAGVPGEAWEGANRTLLYLFVFALFALWPQRGGSAALLLVTWTLAILVVALFVALHLDGAGSASLQSLFPEARLVYPSGYANANAAQWMMAFWPALLLARSKRLPWALRGLLAGGAVLLAELALLSLSRGALFATPVMLVLVFALLPGRLRTFAVLVPVIAGIAASAPAVLRVSDDLKSEQVVPVTLHNAIATVFAASIAVGLLVAVVAALESRRAFSAVVIGQIRRSVGAFAIATLVVVVVGGLVAAGDPVTRVEHAWNTFRSPRAYAADANGNRLVGGLGSQRYDVYRVALDEFVAHPLLGIGSDNFAEPYLAHGRTEVTPHYPHSVELRTLTETGIVGALLAFVGLGAAMLAGWRALLLRRTDPLRGAVAAAALAGFGYWVVHGSFDWFWEFAGLGAPAFALLGLACALAPRGELTRSADLAVGTASSSSVGVQNAGAARSSQAESAPTVRPSRRGLTARRLGLLAGVVVALAAATSLTAPWLSQLQVESAARIWPKAPAVAYARLNGAARLNPLSDEPYLVAGSIALRFGDLARADYEFALALKRTPGDAYATLERGAIASASGDRASALALLRRAADLNPRDPLTREALRAVQRGERVNIEELSRSILLKAQQLT